MDYVIEQRVVTFMKKVLYFYEMQEIESFALENKEIVLYGAGALAKRIIVLLDSLNCKKNIAKIVVTANHQHIESISGITITDDVQALNNATVLVGTIDYRDDILELLREVQCDCFCISDVLGAAILRGDGFCNEKYMERVSNTIKEALNGKSNNSNKSDIVFFTPPYWDAYSPFSAVPCLVAALKKHGFRPKQYDLGIVCVNNTLIREWNQLKAVVLSKNYYDEFITKYRFNTYGTWEAYFDSVSDVLGETYCLEKLKEIYIDLDDTQRAALDGIFSMVEWVNVYGIDFEMCNDIDLELTKFYDESFFECLSSNFFIEAIGNIGKIVGISITSTSQFVYGCALAKIIKKLLPNVTIILGGSCSDVFFKSGYKNKKEIFNYFDYVVIGEGETAITRLVQAIMDDTETEDIPNLIRYSDSDCTLPAIFIEDIDSLESPDYDGLDLEQYLSPKKMLAYQSSRGCHYGYCAFCNHDDKYRHNYRTKKPTEIVKDLLWLHNKYKVDHFQFVDEAIRPDCFEKMIEVMDNYDEFKKIKWFFYSRVSYRYTKKLLEKAKKNGCEMVMFGVETLNQRLLNFIKKGITAEASVYSLKLFHECGIKTFSWLMTNLPSETLCEAKQDLEDVKKVSKYIDAMSVGPFMLVRNTDMYRNPQKFNIIKKCIMDPTRFESHFEGNIINKDEILDFLKNEYYPYIQKMNLNVNRYSLFFKNI